MKLKKSLALVLGATLMIGVFAGCGSEQAPKKDTIKFVSEWKAKKNFESELVDYYNYESKTLSESLDSYSQFSKKSKADSKSTMLKKRQV